MCRRLCCRYIHLERSLASNAWPWFKSRCYIKYGFRLSVLVTFPERFCTENSGFHLSAKTNISKSPNSVVAEQRLTAVKVSSQPEYFLCTMSV